MRLIDADYIKSLEFHKLIHTDYGETAISFEELDRIPTVTIKQMLDELPDHIIRAMAESIIKRNNINNEWELDNRK